jgi:hypothetical protein
MFEVPVELVTQTPLTNSPPVSDEAPEIVIPVALAFKVIVWVRVSKPGEVKLSTQAAAREPDSDMPLNVARPVLEEAAAVAVPDKVQVPLATATATEGVEPDRLVPSLFFSWTEG